MKWKSSNLLAIVLAGLVGSIVGGRLVDHFGLHYQEVAPLVIMVVPSSVFATCAWAVVSRPGNIGVIFAGLAIAGVVCTVCLYASPGLVGFLLLAIPATGWAMGSTLRRWIPIASLPVLGLVLGLIGLIVLWAGATRDYWQFDSLLPLMFLSLAWLQALALEGFREVVG